MVLILQEDERTIRLEEPLVQNAKTKNRSPRKKITSSEIGIVTGHCHVEVHANQNATPRRNNQSGRDKICRREHLKTKQIETDNTKKANLKPVYKYSATQTENTGKHQQTQTETMEMDNDNSKIIIDDKKYSKCPICFVYNSYLPKHLREVHNNSEEEIKMLAKYVKKQDNRSGHTGVEKGKWCPVWECDSKVINISRHLTDHHKLTEEEKYNRYGIASR